MHWMVILLGVITGLFCGYVIGALATIKKNIWDIRKLLFALCTVCVNEEKKQNAGGSE